MVLILLGHGHRLVFRNSVECENNRANRAQTTDSIIRSGSKDEVR